VTLADAKARSRIQSDFDATLVVEAAAGTGKTTELIGRIVALLATGRTTLDRVLAVTFTDKAAGEMKLRLRSGLERARERASGVEHDRLTDALRLLEVAQISTIHSFCADLLREWPVEARIDPLFDLAAGEAATALFDQAFDSWFQRDLAAPGEGVRRALRRRQRGRDRVNPRQALREAARALSEHRDFDAPWTTEERFDRSAEMAAVIDRLADAGSFAARARNPEDWIAKSLVEVAGFTEELQRREAIRGRDEDGLEAALCELSKQKFWGWRGGSKWFGEGLEKAAVLARRDEAKQALDAFVVRAEADLAARLREELRVPLAAYQALKDRSGKLDFLDLLLRARDLVRDVPAVREELQRRFTHLLVDEFQDTDPLQAEILLLLAADDPAVTDWTRARPSPGKLFLVGDPKQSVYRFRRADIALYQRVKNLLVASGAEVVHLTTSFRAVPSIQEVVNAAFSLRMVPTTGGSQAEYVPLDPYRPEPEGRPSVVALPAPRIYGDYGKVVHWKIEESYPVAVGAFIDWLLHKSGWTVTERDGGPRAIEARHVCILFKRMYSFGEDLVRGYVRALEARSIPHVLVGGGSYHEREETLAVRNAASAIEWPADELAVFATLRGPFFALGDDALLAFRHANGRLHPLRRFDEAKLEPDTREVAEALAVLGELHRFRNRRPIADTLGRLFDATRAHAGLAMGHAGEQALANALRVLDLARRFESSGATSFRSFVDWLYLAADRGDTGEAPVIEEGTEGVRIMTVHGAKGLEFPVVILADPTAPAAPKNPSRFLDAERRICAMPLAGCVPLELDRERAALIERDREETVRTAYVAATRARDLLVVPVNGDEERESWLDALNPAVHPDPAERRDPRPAPGCPTFGRDTVLDRPEAAARTAAAVRPGLHRPQAGKHGVVWWDPRALDLDREPDGGLRRESLLHESETKEMDIGVARAHEAWREGKAARVEAGSVPSFRVVAPTGLAAPAPAAAGAASDDGATFEAVPNRDPGRPRGKRFGILLHATLADVDLAADAAAVGLLAANLGRVLGATEEEVAAAGAATVAALRHPLLLRAAASADCRREVPVSHVLPGGEVVEGSADLAFREQTEEGPRWVVVDFKSDAHPEEEPRYRAQIGAYVDAIRAATGEAGRGVILAV